MLAVISTRLIVGRRYAWGTNDYGQLGDGTAQQRLVPATVSGGMTFTAVTAGNAHTCALTSIGAAYCWGFNLYGGLGDLTNTSRASQSS